MNVNFHKVQSMQSQFLWNLTFIFSDFRDKFSLVLLQMIFYIFSPWKVQGFCTPKIKISQFPSGFRLNFSRLDNTFGTSF